MAIPGEIKRKYKERKPEAGIYYVRNRVTNRVFIGSSKNLHGPLNSLRFMLSIGSHRNEELQADWKKYGADAFEFETCDVVKVKDDPGFSVDDELLLLEQIWIEKLRIFEGGGYNINKNIRDAWR